MTTAVQAHCIRIAVRAQRVALAVRLILIAEVGEGRGVFIANVQATAAQFGLSAHQFAGGLASLMREGFYEPSYEPEYNGAYGYVHA